MAAAAQDTNAIRTGETKAGNNDLAKEDLASEEKNAKNIGSTKGETSQVGKENELKSTKPEKNEIEDSVEAGFEIIATDQIKQEPQVIVDSVESIGTIKDIDKEKPVTTEIKVSEKENKDEETQEQRVTGKAVEEIKDAATIKDKTLPTATKDSAKIDGDEIKEELKITASAVEIIGSIKETESDKEKSVPTDTKISEFEKVSEAVSDNVTHEKQKEKESPEASVIDIKIIKESADNSNKESPESESHSSEELEAALTAIPELSSAVSKEILADANNEGEVKKIVAEIEQKTEERPEGTLIDITVIEETNKDKNVQEVIKEAENSFEAEVIEDNADIEVVPSEGEEVIEYTLEARDAIPVITILVALVAVFVAIIFYYN